MPGLLVSHQFNARYGTDFVAAGKRNSVDIELLVLPPDPEARIDEAAAARAEIAYFSSDIIPLHTKQFFSATRKSPALKWMQVFNAGVDHPVFASVLERGVRLTTSSGTAAEPIAQTAPRFSERPMSCDGTSVRGCATKARREVRTRPARSATIRRGGGAILDRARR